MHRDGTRDIWQALGIGSIPAVKYYCTFDENTVLRHDPNNDKRLTVLHYAAQAGCSQIVAFVLENGAKVDALDFEQVTPLMMACQKGHSQVVEMLIKHGAAINHQDIYGRTPLHMAAIHNQFEIYRLLSMRWANKWIVNKAGEIPLDCILNRFMNEDNIEIEKYLKHFP